MLRRFLAAILIVLSASAAAAERRVALVMAADDYRLLRPLHNAVNDARAIKAALERVGFEVTLETDRDLRRMRRTLEDFREDAAGADVALVFFSGHGVELAGDNRLLPVDADAASLERLKQTSLPLEEVRDAVAQIARIGLIVLDACRNDPFGSDGGGGRSAVPLKPEVAAVVKPGLGRVGRAENILFSFSAAPGETASDGAGGNSEFSAALAKFLPTEGLEIRSVLTLVQQEVYDFSRGAQLPYVESGLPRLFFAAQSSRELPERDRLLLAMAEISPALRAEVETVAAASDVPLAPLYAALIGSDAGAMREGERRRKLSEAAQAFVQVRADMRRLAAADPRVAALRGQAEARLALGAFDEARALLVQAADIDGQSRLDLKASFIARTLSEADTHYLAGTAARAELRYALAIEDYGKAAALYADVDGFDLPDDARYQHALSLEQIGMMQTTLGDLSAARAAYDALDRVAARRAALKPDDTRLQRDRVVAQNKLASVMLATGDFKGAITILERSQQTLSELMNRHFDIEYARDLAVAYNQSGDIRRRFGDVQGALIDYRGALGIVDLLATNFPEQSIFPRDLAVSHSKVGRALIMSRDYRAALTELEQSLAILERLAGESPADRDLRRNMTVDLNASGEAHALLGDNGKASELFGKAVAISQELTLADPANTEWRRDLAIALNNRGDAKGRSGDGAGGLADYRSSLAIAEYLADLDGSNVEWARDLSVAHNRVGDALLALGDRAAAAVSYRDALAVMQKLRAASPNNATWRRDEALTRNRLGGVLEQADPDAALAEYRAALALVTGLRDISPDEPTWRRDESITRNNVGRTLLAKGDLAAALAEFDASLAVLDLMAQANGADPAPLQDIAFMQNLAGDALFRQGKFADAAARYRASLYAAGRLAAIAPAGSAGAGALYDARFRLADALWAQGAHAGAIEMLQAAAAQAEAARQADPDAVQPRLMLSLGLYKLGVAGVDPAASFRRSRDILTGLGQAGRLPAANRGWIDVVEAALRQAEGR